MYLEYFYSNDKLTMHIEIELMLRNLNVVGSLQPNDKLNTESPLFSVYVPTPTRGLMRLWCQEDRESNASAIQSVVRQTTSYVLNAQQSRHTQGGCIVTAFKDATEMQLCSRMLETLQMSVYGLEHMCQTYREDASILAKLQMIKHEILDFLFTTKHMLIHRDRTPLLELGADTADTMCEYD